MQGQVIDGEEISQAFGVMNGTKQGCVLAPLLFIIFFSMLLFVAFKDCELGVPIDYRTDGSVFNLRRLQAKSKTLAAIIRDLLYADDCALVAHTLSEAQQLFDRFFSAAQRFGLTVSLKKTEVLMQPVSGKIATSPVVKAGDVILKNVEKFCYLGSTISADAMIDDDVTARLAKASHAFGCLSKRLWGDPGIRLDTKIAVYKAAIINTLLYGCESWTTYRRHISKLDQFHMRCLRRIAHIKWQDKVPNTQVLDRCDISGIEAFLLSHRLRWTGHVIRMNDDRLPKQVFYSQLSEGHRSRGGQRKRYKDVLKSNLKDVGLEPKELESLVVDRSSWRSLSKQSVLKFEHQRVDLLQEKRSRRKGQIAPSHSGFQCDFCGRTCASRIGLFSHRRTHL
jgi:hypothetical protein